LNWEKIPATKSQRIVHFEFDQMRGHPGYSGAILTATFVLARDLGWPYLEKLAQQKVMQVQSAADPPKKILLGDARRFLRRTTRKQFIAR
jgi:hypothetical protein